MTRRDFMDVLIPILKVGRFPALFAGAALCLSGCSAPVLDPGGPVASAQRDLLFYALGLMAIVVVPVWVLVFVFVRRYRAGAGHAYTPDWKYSGPIDLVIWIVPALIVVGIGTLVWVYTHDLDPYKPIASDQPPLRVQAVAEDWKWLFIYPDQDIATVNDLVFVAGRPLAVEITADTAMSAFYVPGLGGQIFAMAGMRTKMNLMSDQPRTYEGRNTQFTGEGFPDQSFAGRAVTPDDFDIFVSSVKQQDDRLDAAAYARVHAPSHDVPVQYFSGVTPDLFAAIIAKYHDDGEPM